MRTVTKITAIGAGAAGSIVLIGIVAVAFSFSYAMHHVRLPANLAVCAVTKRLVGPPDRVLLDGGTRGYGYAASMYDLAAGGEQPVVSQALRNVSAGFTRVSFGESPVQAKKDLARDIVTINSYTASQCSSIR